MRRLFATLGLLLLALPTVALDLPELQQRGTLKVLGVVIEAEPQFLCLKPGAAPGFDHEVLDRFAQLNKLRMEIVPVAGYDGLIPALLKGKGDIIAGGFTATDSRRKQIVFSEESFPTRNVVYNRKPAKPIASLDELKGLRVGTYKGTSMAEDLAGAGITNVDDGIVLGGFPEALKSGRIGAAVDGIEAVLLARLRDPELQVGPFIGAPESLAYGVRKEDAALLVAVNVYLSNLRKTPTWSRLVVKYFGEQALSVLGRAKQ